MEENKKKKGEEEIKKKERARKSGVERKAERASFVILQRTRY